ncbi:MAG TPA: 3-isopropylmalate dehydratase small subunit [Candidatus Saccharimonadales bacterium]|jgi:3-isopropylmalate/(R)-2-methylmalate dehydratase small subunit|nr:3-isopropylmalate dehydratase small subunit [Candidatus Saccharimonadales bacterium]
MSEIVKITKISGTAVPIHGNDIDTDRIIPARYLKEVTFARMGEYPFFDERFDASGKKKDHPFNDSEYKGASLLFVNKNFGCGSSREHAPQALYRFGIQAIVGESFAAIFAGNCTMMGLPAVVVSANEIEQLMKSVEEDPRTEYSVDLENKTLSYGQQKIAIDLPETYRIALTAGSWNSTALLHANLDQVKKTAAKLPYMTGFSS